MSIVGKWDLIIAHPPCTYLSTVATRHHSLKSAQLTSINARTQKRIDGMLFFMAFVNANCKYIAVENPVGVMNVCYRKPDQIIDPYMFAKNIDDVENYVSKRTCLWLKNLPLLAGNDLPRPDNLKLFGINPSGKISNWEERVTGKDRAKERSKTFEGIASAMAMQWGDYIKGDFIPDRYGQLSF